jgi:fructose-bisphosphate aldolase, class I
MREHEIIDIARRLVAGGKGLLAMDESNPTCNKRFAVLGIPQTAESRRAYRELIVNTTGLSTCISGAILYDETIWQQKKDGTPFAKAWPTGIIPGIKVDAGAKEMAAHPGEKIIEGLDGLRDRLATYSQMGALARRGLSCVCRTADSLSLSQLQRRGEYNAVMEMDGSESSLRGDRLAMAK